MMRNNRVRRIREEMMGNNRVRKTREEKMISKAELARKAGVSVQTIDRIEKGMSCRLDTKRKILLAFGYPLEEKEKIFGGDA
jgi:DNA-binding XRE family transcriptional regulator